MQGQVLYTRQFYSVNQRQDPGNRQTWVPYDEAASKEQQTRYSKKTKNEINRESSRKFSTDRKNDLENRSKAKVYIFASNGYPRSDRQEIIRNRKMDSCEGKGEGTVPPSGNRRNQLNS